MRHSRAAKSVLLQRLFLEVLPFANYRFCKASLFNTLQADVLTVLTSTALPKSHGRMLPDIIRSEMTLLHRQEWGTPDWLSRLL